MLYWSVIFFVVAIVAAFFGFGGVADAATDIAQVLFFLFIAAFLVTLAAGLFMGKKAKDKIDRAF